ncbi:unnamed protein product [Cylicostephanus goldi]|uniref:Uncharacterized protein n=1 Tax=Cylicostephanus goldi TaxID=71465 RepID=A0A3P7QAZ1_CYLGO|nr:unnamed protein product [Cylicostephanus goldi]
MTATSTTPEAEHHVEKRSAKTGHGHRVSDKHQIQIRDKRSTDEDSEDTDEELTRRRRSTESDEEEEDKSLLEHGEYHGHAERKRRSTSGSEEDPHNLLKRHIGHHILAHGV